MTGLALFRTVGHCLRTILPAVVDLLRLAVLMERSRRSLAAENLFLPRQLALFQERKVKPRRAGDATRGLMATLGQLFDRRTALVVVKPDTLSR